MTTIPPEQSLAVGLWYPYRICWIKLGSMGKPCGVWKMIQIFQAHLHMTSAGTWQKPWIFHMCNEEFWMAWHPACSCKERCFLVYEPVPHKERRFKGSEQRRRFQLHMANCHTKKEKDNAQKSTEQCQSCGISIRGEPSIWLCRGCLQWNFILYFI